MATQSPYNTKEFIELRRKWYKKLAKDGFEDVEQEDGHLKLWTSKSFYKMDPLLFESKQQYYNYAGQFLHDHKFSSKTEKFIWESHAAGIGGRDIVKLLKKRGVSSYKKKIDRIIRELKKVMMQEYGVKYVAD